MISRAVGDQSQRKPVQNRGSSGGGSVVVVVMVIIIDRFESRQNIPGRLRCAPACGSVRLEYRQSLVSNHVRRLQVLALSSIDRRTYALLLHTSRTTLSTTRACVKAAGSQPCPVELGLLRSLLKPPRSARPRYDLFFSSSFVSLNLYLTCNIQAAAYGKCVVADYNAVQKDMCAKEFMRLKDCFLVG